MSDEGLSELGLLLKYGSRKDKIIENINKTKDRRVIVLKHRVESLPALPNDEEVYEEIQRRLEPKPPKEYLQANEHHWLTEVDKDGKTIGLVVLQWVPSSRRWCHSGYNDTGRYVNTANWRYYGHCRKPNFNT